MNYYLFIVKYHPRSATAIPGLFKESDLSGSSMLKQLLRMPSEGGNFPDMTEKLNFFDGAFDHERAKSEGKIIPSKGVDADYDSALDEIDATKGGSKYFEFFFQNVC